VNTKPVYQNCGEPLVPNPPKGVRCVGGGRSPVTLGGKPGTNKWIAWLSVLGATVGMLVCVVVGLNLVAIVLHPFRTGFPALRTPQGLTILFATGSMVGEALMVLVLWRILRRKNDSLSRLGLWKSSSSIGWSVALLVAAFSVVPAVKGFHNGALHLAYSKILFEPSFFHICAALILGFGAGFCEEIMFRGYVMTRLLDAGYGAVVQVIASGVLFGLAHGLYALSNGVSVGLDIMSHTALLGALYAITYLLSRRSLMPCILAHLLNDAIVLPWVFLTMFSAR
jgi:uncharacterized protein